jgi:hypothetical protein
MLWRVNCVRERLERTTIAVQVQCLPRSNVGARPEPIGVFVESG